MYSSAVSSHRNSEFVLVLDRYMLSQGTSLRLAALGVFGIDSVYKRNTETMALFLELAWPMLLLLH